MMGQKSFEELVNAIDLVEYVQHCGYVLDKKKSSAAQKVFKKIEGGGTTDAVIVMQGKTNQFYYNPMLDSDKGNLINFAMNRLAPGYITPNKNKHDYMQVSKDLHDYLGIPVEQRVKNVEKVLITKDRQPFNVHLYNARELEDLSFLESRGISREVINHPLFKGKVIQVNDYDHKKQESFKYPVTAFLLYSKGKISGIEMRGEGFKKFGEFSNRTNSIWISNTADKTTNIYVAETPIDALSHFQVTYSEKEKREQALYVSTGGSLARNQIPEIISVAADVGAKQIISLTDNDLSGCLYDFEIIRSLDKNSLVDLISKDRLELKFRFAPGVNEAKLKSFFNYFSQYNTRQKSLLKTYSQKEKENNPKYAALFSAARDKDGAYIVKVPQKLEAFKLFNERLTKLLDLKLQFGFDKSQMKDWNDDLVNGIRREQKKSKQMKV